MSEHVHFSGLGIESSICPLAETGSVVEFLVDPPICKQTVSSETYLYLNLYILNLYMYT